MVTIADSLIQENFSFDSTLSFLLLNQSGCIKFYSNNFIKILKTGGIAAVIDKPFIDLFKSVNNAQNNSEPLMVPSFIKSNLWHGVLQLNIPAPLEYKFETLIFKTNDNQITSNTQYMVLLWDQTQVERLESLNKEKDKQLATASKLAILGEVAGSIGHEINNPLAIISGSVSILNREIHSHLPNPSIESSIKRIHGSIDRIVKILRSLKNIVRNSVLDEPEPVMLNEIISDVSAILEPALRMNNVQLFVRANTPLEKTGLLCRPSEISQVFLNLFKNAIDAQSLQQEKWIILDVTSNATTVHARVIDSGPGIPVEIEQKIFDPLFSTKKTGSGNGLGQSISKKIIEQHGGTLSIDRNYPNTCFWIQFPAFQLTIHNLHQIKTSPNAEKDFLK